MSYFLYLVFSETFIFILHQLVLTFHENLIVRDENSFRMGDFVESYRKHKSQKKGGEVSLVGV